MKNSSLFALIALALLSLACVKEENETVPENPDGTSTITFTAEEPSRTTIDSNDEKVSWVKNDEVKFIWSGGSTTARASKSGSSTTFTVTIDNGLDEIYAVYPASACGTFDGSSVNLLFGNALTDGSFGANGICVAKATRSGSSWNTTLHFKNAACLMKVGVTDADITRVQVQAVGSEAIAGTLPVSINGSGNLVTGVASSTSSIVNMTVSGTGNYYIPVFPGVTLSDGFRINLFKGEVQQVPFFYNGSFTTTVGNVIGLSDIESRAGNYYVTPLGAGTKTGQSWTNAMDKSQFKTFIETSGNYFLVRDAVFHLSADDFTFGDYLQPDFTDRGEVAFTIEGAISGSDTTSFIGGTGSKAGTLWPKANATVTVKNVKFTGTDGNSNYAAIRINTGSATLKLDHCVFCNNQTAGNAGSIAMFNGTLDIQDCMFRNNSGSFGPAVYAEHGSVTIGGTTFKYNVATSGTSNKGGGAICIKSKGISIGIENCQFLYNQTSTGNGCGGAIAAYPDDSNPDDVEMTISGSAFTGNYAHGWGGAILFKTSGSLSVSDNTSFTNNYAGGDSGAVNLDVGDFSFEDVSFSGNHADGDHGGVMWVDTGTYEFTNCEFNGNYTVKSGGVIYIHDDGEFTFTGCEFKNNHANQGGGAVSIVDGDATVSFSGGKFQGNYAVGTSSDEIASGAAIYASGTNVSFDCTNVEFSSNYNSIGTNTDIGGIIRVKDSGGLARFDGCIFDGNYSYLSSSANYAPAIVRIDANSAVTPTFYFNACEFKNNSSGVYNTKTGGKYGMLFALNYGATLAFNNCSFHDNYGQRNTGPLDWISVANGSATLIMANSTIVGDPKRNASTAPSSGNPWSLLYFDNNPNIYLINNIIATTTSGSYYSIKSNSSTTINNSYYNKTSPVSGTVNWGTDSGSGHDYYTSSFSSWDGAYIWNGTMTGTNSGSKAGRGNVGTQISNASSDFYDWLKTVGALDSDGKPAKDIAGRSVPTPMAPGCYQP